MTPRPYTAYWQDFGGEPSLNAWVVSRSGIFVCGFRKEAGEDDAGQRALACRVAELLNDSEGDG